MNRAAVTVAGATTPRAERAGEGRSFHVLGVLCGQLLQARLAGRVGIGFGATVMLGFAAVFWLLSDPLIGLFLDHNDPAFHDVIVLAVSLLAVAAWFELFDGVQTIAMGCIRGLKDAKTTFLVAAGWSGSWRHWPAACCCTGWCSTCWQGTWGLKFPTPPPTA